MPASNHNSMEDHVNATEPSPSFFEILPQEIRDKIYEYAFQPKSEITKVVWRKQWKDREMKKREDTNRKNKYSRGPAETYEIKPFPGNPFHPMLVSRQFFQEAANAWFRRATLEFSNAGTLDLFIQRLNYTPISSISAIRVDWECSKLMHGVFSPNLRWCTGLRSLQVTVTDGIGIIEDKIDFIDDLEQGDFESLQIVQDISATTCIRKLGIKAGLHRQVSTEQETTQYSKNMEAMRDYIMARINVCTDRDSETAPSERRDDCPTVQWLGAEKEAAWTDAVFGRTLRFNNFRAVLDVDNKHGSERSSTASVSSGSSITTSTVADPDVEMEDDDILMTDDWSTTESSSRKREPSVQRGRALTSDIGRSRIAKSSTRRRERSESSRRHRRSRVSGMEMAVGGILFVNTVFSMLAFYYSTHR